MTTISKNIKFLRKRKRLTQEQLAEKIGIKRSLLGAYEEGRADPRLNNLLAVSRIFDVSVDRLISGELTEEGLSANPSHLGIENQSLKVLSITVDKENRENIELVPYKASAGYLNGYSDPEYIENLPRFQLPTLPSSGTYRAFEISGDSMLPLQSGTVIIGQYLEHLENIKGGQTYVLLTKTEGVVYKRVSSQLTEKGTLVLISDNIQYSPYEIDVAEILEVWEAIAYISKSFPQPNTINSIGSLNDHGITLEKLTSMVLDLQKEVIKLQSGRS